MKFAKILKHIGIIAAGIILIIGVPLLCTGYLSALISGSYDTMSSASVVLAQPSGEYLVLINKDYHQDQESLDEWKKFFSGSDEDELIVIFEDVAVSVAGSDAGGVQMADSLRSQLPENQMKVKSEDATLLLSRADNGLFDIIVMSKEFADGYHAQTAFKSNVEIVELKSK